VRMDQACGLERKGRVYVSHKRLGRVLRMDPLGHMGPVYERCLRMDLVCGLQEGTDAVAVVDKDHCSRSGRIRRILLDCYLKVSDTLQTFTVNSQGSCG
jgi:hypothetical protein